MAEAKTGIIRTRSLVDARRAWYVIGSTRKGGMGGDEAVPFGQEQAARQFAEAHGGEVVAFDAVPRAMCWAARIIRVIERRCC